MDIRTDTSIVYDENTKLSDRLEAGARIIQDGYLSSGVHELLQALTCRALAIILNDKYGA